VFSLTAHPWWRRWFGSRSERAAARFLRRLGYSLLEHNFSCELGEIDIIALDGKTIVFVEVRSTEGADTAMPALSVDPAKQKRLTRLALYYLQKRRLLDCSARFDVLAISWPASQEKPTIVHYPNAFEATDRFQPYS
jgi:putative endonuclease